MLEIGLQRGDVTMYRDPHRTVNDLPSIRMWLEYFPGVHCWGFDLADFSSFSMPGFTFFRGDLSSAADLKRLGDEMGTVRIMIDDGSHASYHQQMALVHLFPKLEAGGLYVVEDLQYQPPYETELPECLKTRDVVTQFVSTGKINIPFATFAQKRVLERSIRNTFIVREPSSDEKVGRIKLVCFRKHC